MTTLARLFGAALSLALVTPANASAPSPAIQEAIRNVNPVAKIDSVRATPVPGLMEVRSEGAVVYVTADGRHLFAGDLYDVKSRRNLTDVARQDVRAGILGEIDRSTAIRFGAKDAKHTVLVFTDPSCPYCSRLHKDIPELNRLGIAVEYLAYPRAGIQSEPGQLLNGAWCAANQQKAMDAAFAGTGQPGKGCSQVLRRHVEAARLLEVEGTPTVFTLDGRQLGGYLPPAEMAKALGG